jgi:CBS domain-containing protein
MFYINRIKTSFIMMNIEVRRIMTSDPIVVSPTQSLQEVAQIMLSKKLQQLPVVEDGKLVGLLTSYDLWKDTHSKSASMATVQDAMTTNVLTITPKDKVATAAQLFADKRFKTLPVVNLRNELKGVVTAFDVIRQAYISEYPRPILYKEEFLKKAL